MRVVLDTNVLISAFVFPGGVPEQVYRCVLDGRITFVTSRPLLSELGRVLTAKFGWEPVYAEGVIAQLLRVAVLVDPREQVTDITDDPADNRILEAAAEGGVEAIVSGDRHLRALGSWRGIRIVEPTPFMEQLQ